MTTAPQAAWYQDPTESSRIRYWDGSRWTGHTAPAPGSVLAPARVPDRAQSPHVRPPEPRSRRGLTGQEPPTIEEIIGRCRQEEPRSELDEQVELTGETHYIKGIKKVFRQHGMPITDRGSNLEHVRCVLVPNPWNPHDANAVAVCVGTHQVGHLPAEMCPDYSPALIELAQSDVLVTGEARIWAKSDAGVVRARVTVLIPEASELP